MAKQFVYQDLHGILYPAHGALAFQPGLVPGWYDTDTRTFTPVGNPQEQVGNIVTDAGVGASTEKVLSGLREDHGAGTAPLAGVAFTATDEGSEADLAARLVETEAALTAERERVVALEAQVAILRGTAGESPTEAGMPAAPEDAPAPTAGTASTDAASSTEATPSTDSAPSAPPTSTRRARKVM